MLIIGYREVSTMKYPVWFPYPSCWLKTLILSFSLSFVIFLLRITGRISLRALNIVFAEDYEYLVWVALGWLIIFGVILPIFLFSHVYQFLWSDRNPRFPVWLPNWFSLGEGIWSWQVTIIGLVVGLFMIVEFSPGSSFYDIDPELTKTQLKIGVISWFFTSAYLHHMRLLLGKMFDRFKQPRKKRAT